MKVVYQKRFLKDLAAVPSNLRRAIERFVFEESEEGKVPEQSIRVELAKGWEVRMSDEDLLAVISKARS